MFLIQIKDDLLMLFKAGYYYDKTITQNRDIPPKKEMIFVISAGHSRPISKQCVETVHLSRKDYQLLYVNKGMLHYFNIDNTEHIVPEGSFLLYKPLEYQKYYMYLSENADIYWCHFSGTFVESLLKNYDIYDKKTIALSPDKKFRKLYSSMRLALENKPMYYMELCSLYLQELIITIGGEIKNQHSQNNIPSSLNYAINYIHEHYYEDIIVTDLAKICASNKITLTRHFEKYLNCSPKKYINKFRIKKAKILLLQSEYKINEISSAVGFQDPLYFSTAFRAETGMSPREYRNQNK